MDNTSSGGKKRPRPLPSVLVTGPDLSNIIPSTNDEEETMDRFDNVQPPKPTGDTDDSSGSNGGTPAAAADAAADAGVRCEQQQGGPRSNEAEKRVPHQLDNGNGPWTLQWIDNPSSSLLGPDNISSMGRIYAQRSCLIAIRGRGRIMFEGSRTLQPSTTTTSEWKQVQVNGYSTSPSSYLMDTNVSMFQKQEQQSVFFDSPSWLNGITIDMPANRSVIIMADTTTALIPHSTSNSINNESRVLANGNPPVLSSAVSFPQIVSAHDPRARPTIIPESWKLAMDIIEKDLVVYWTTMNQQQYAIFNNTNFLDHDDDDAHPMPDNVAIHQTNHQHDHETNMNSGTSGFQIVIAGAKNVGKSTCLRYCVNRLLSLPPSSSTLPFRPSSSTLSSSSNAVAVLDADAGQPEFGPPGIVSLVIVYQPMLQPPHMNLLLDAAIPKSHEIIQSYLYGSVTSQTDPHRYLQCLRCLVDEYKTHIGPMIPLVIHLDGWVKGLGLQVVQAIIHDVLQPNHIIQIVGSLKSRMFDLQVPLSSSTSSSSRLPTGAMINDNHTGNNGVDSSSIPVRMTRVHRCLAYNCTTRTTGKAVHNSTSNNTTQDQEIDPSFKATALPSLSIPPSALRSLRLISYFLRAMDEDKDDGTINHSMISSIQLVDQLVNSQYTSSQMGFLDDPYGQVAETLVHLRPYAVSMDIMYYQFSMGEMEHDIMSDDMLFRLLNASIVGLCVYSQGTTESFNLYDKSSSVSSSSSTIAMKPLPSSLILPCIGLGLVRSIDKQNRILFLLTPLNIHELNSVNVVTLGHSNLSVPLECMVRDVTMIDSFPYLSCPLDMKKLNIPGTDPMKSRNNISRKTNNCA